MKSLVNKLRKLNISNSVIELQTGFDSVQLKAYNREPKEFPLMHKRLMVLYLSRLEDKHHRIQLSMVPKNVHISSQSHDHSHTHENILARGWKALKRKFQRKII